MTLKLWRYSHFALAISSALFIFLATITGAILAFEPIDNKLQGHRVAGAQEIPLAQVIDTLLQQYDEILEIEVNENQYVKASVISMVDSLNGDFYINPITGHKLADIPDKRPLFEFMTNFHRSLFLKTPGRIFVGLTSFFLLLIAISGFFLFLKRQNGLRHFFAKIIKEDFFQYYHVVLSRWMFIPIIIIAFTGVYLSLLRFEYIPEPAPVSVFSEAELNTEPALSFSDFGIFQETTLGEVRNLEFPFSSDVEDFFILSLKDRQLKINQKTGAVVEELRFPLINLFSKLNFNLHTGKGSILWSIILFIAAINIVFFIYSGLAISYRRTRTRIKNQVSADQAEIVILVGSENGSTKNFGNLLLQALLGAKQKVYLGELNQYRPFGKMQHLLVLTSTYGDGDPPANGDRFLKLLGEHPLADSVRYSVVGFGSLAYPNFCQFALDIEAALKKSPASSGLPGKPFLIHNKSYTSFQKWAGKWGETLGLQLELPAQIKPKKTPQHSFTIMDKQRVDDGYSDTYTLVLKMKNHALQSGDLLGVVPPTDPVERLYSVARLDQNRIFLAIKRHEYGVCSQYLDTLPVGSSFKASVQRNGDFHFPNNGKPVILVGNGTGIAPFIGMIQSAEYRVPIHLYWGGRNRQSISIYQEWIDRALEAGTLTSCQIAYSKVPDYPSYVQELLWQDQATLAGQLAQGATLMICGSVLMQNGVLEALDQITQRYNDTHLNTYQQKGQILMDCY